MFRNLILLFPLFLLCCFKTGDHSNKILFQANDSLRQGPCAVFVAPTSPQIDSLKLKMKEKDFFTMADDNMVYMAGARSFLRTKNVLTSDVEAVGVVKFKSKSGKIFEQKLSGLTWAVILFNGKDAPIIASMVGIENDYTRYMK
jgi:hypothetical protein